MMPVHLLNEYKKLARESVNYGVSLPEARNCLQDEMMNVALEKTLMVNRACRLLGVSRRVFYYERKIKESDDKA